MFPDKFWIIVNTSRRKNIIWLLCSLLSILIQAFQHGFFSKKLNWSFIGSVYENSGKRSNRKLLIRIEEIRGFFLKDGMHFFPRANRILFNLNKKTPNDWVHWTGILVISAMKEYFVCAFHRSSGRFLMF